MHNPTGRKAKTTESLSQLIAVAVEQHALEVGKLLNSLSCSGTGLPLKKSVPLRAWEGNIGENKDTNVTKALSTLVSPLEQWAEDWNAPLCSWAPHSPGWLRWELKVRWKFSSLCAFAPPSPTQKCFSRVLLPYSWLSALLAWVKRCPHVFHWISGNVSHNFLGDVRSARTLTLSQALLVFSCASFLSSKGSKRSDWVGGGG